MPALRITSQREKPKNEKTKLIRYAEQLKTFKFWFKKGHIYKTHSNYKRRANINKTSTKFFFQQRIKILLLI